MRNLRPTERRNNQPESKANDGALANPSLEDYAPACSMFAGIYDAFPPHSPRTFNHIILHHIYGQVLERIRFRLQTANMHLYLLGYAL